LIADELDEQLAEVTGEQDRKELYGRIAARVRAAPLAPTQFRKEDFYGACIVFCLVVLASVPAVLPFLIIDNLKLALRVSNGVLLATLFYVGFAWARHTVARPWMVAMSLVGGGLVLVVAAIALGG
jgi:VIT1/CCC1 family predicted Fe2+/Mn2+ transporter